MTFGYGSLSLSLNMVPTTESLVVPIYGAGFAGNLK
jgi:hypothetical protein